MKVKEKDIDYRVIYLFLLVIVIFLALNSFFSTPVGNKSGQSTADSTAQLGSGNQLLLEKTRRTYLEKAAMERMSGEISRAADTLQDWLNNQPEDAETALKLASLLAVDKPQEALRLLLEIKTTNPQASERINLLRNALSGAEFEKDESYRFMMIGRALANMGDWDLAAALFEQSVQVSPRYAEAWAFLGEARQHIGQDGLKELQRAQEIEPNSAITQALLALYWRRRDEYSRAIEFLEAAAVKEPDQPVWQMEIGGVYAQKGNLIKALKYYQKAAQMEPGSPVYWQALAEFSVVNNVQVREVGLPAVRQALALAPHNAVSLDLMGWTMFNLEDYPSAERFLEKAVEEAPDFALSHLHLGQFYMQAGDRELAVTHLKRAIVLAGEGSPIGKQAVRWMEIAP